MLRSEQEILNDLISNWISLGLEYAKGAPEIAGIYVYASSEEGESYANFLFEQGGQVCYASNLRGVASDGRRVLQMQRLQLDDLERAETEFAGAQVPLPTEYRVYYEPATKKLDVQLSREIKYANHPFKTSVHGPEDWLDRLPKVHGKYLPLDDS